MRDTSEHLAGFPRSKLSVGTSNLLADDLLFFSGYPSANRDGGKIEQFANVLKGNVCAIPMTWAIAIKLLM